MDQTVQGTDMLFPQIGEIIGGSVREENYDKLVNEIEERNIPMKDLWWYLIHAVSAHVLMPDSDSDLNGLSCLSPDCRISATLFRSPELPAMWSSKKWTSV